MTITNISKLVMVVGTYSPINMVRFLRLTLESLDRDSISNFYCFKRVPQPKKPLFKFFFVKIAQEMAEI